MNEDISSHDENDAAMEPVIESGDLQVLREKLACNTLVDQGCDPEELNPRNYAFLPSCWTQKIRPAGRKTAKTESLQGIFC